MSFLILIYHRTTDTGGGNANPHCLPARNFREQIGHLRRGAYPVVSWRGIGEKTSLERGALQVALTFDDGCQSDLENARLLHSLGYDALFFIATEYLGTPGYVRRADVIELQRLGMGIGSHSHHHVQLVPLSDTEVRDELGKSKAILEDIVQAPVEYLSFPGGSYNARILDIARKVGYRYFFTSDWGVNARAQFSARVLRRTSVLNNLDVTQFDALLRLRNYYVRQLGFMTKELMKKAVGPDRYSSLRRALLNVLRKS